MQNNHLVTIGVLVLLCAIQLFAASQIRFYGALPDLLTVFIAYIALRDGPNISMTYGFAAGLLLGLMTATPGLDALTKTLEGFVAGFFHIPEDSHASSTQKKRMYFTALFFAAICGKIIMTLAVNILALPILIHILFNIVIATALTMLAGFLAYRYFFSKTLLFN